MELILYIESNNVCLFLLVVIPAFDLVLEPKILS